MVIPNSSSLQTEIFKLMADKSKLESIISTYGAILAQNDNIGMNGALIDAEGFPRNDIDVYQVRQARQQIICLQNDHASIMKDIERLIHELHADAKRNGTSHYLSGEASRLSLNGSSSDNNEDTIEVLQKSFLKVNSVSVGSPAEQAGLCENDEICEFGSANANNFDKKLDTIAKIVKNMRDQHIPLKVRRNNEILNLILIPKTWSGHGLLGCRIVLTNN